MFLQIGCRAVLGVKFKSCGLTFVRSANQWRYGFPCIKPHLFDELWPAIYTSVGSLAKASDFARLELQ